MSSSSEQDGERGQQTIGVPETSFSLTLVESVSSHSLGRGVALLSLSVSSQHGKVNALRSEHDCGYPPSILQLDGELLKHFTPCSGSHT